MRLFQVAMETDLPVYCEYKGWLAEKFVVTPVNKNWHESIVIYHCEKTFRGQAIEHVTNLYCNLYDYVIFSK